MCGETTLIGSFFSGVHCCSTLNGSIFCVFYLFCGSKCRKSEIQNKAEKGNVQWPNSNERFIPRNGICGFSLTKENKAMDFQKLSVR